jgi:hypothetical protein
MWNVKKSRYWALSLAWLILLVFLLVAPVRADHVEADAAASILPFRYAWVKHDDTPVYPAPGDPARMTPIRTLHSAMWVSIVDEVQVGQDTWHRIGEGAYVHGDHLWMAKPSPFHGVQLADPGRAPLGFVLGKDLNVRARPGAGAGNPPVAKIQRYTVVDILDSVTAMDGVWYRIGTDRYVHSAHIGVVNATSRPEGVAADEKWIAVNLAEQTLAAYEGDRMVYATLVSSGLPWWSTPEGLFRVQRKLRYGDMSGRTSDGEVYYLVQDVPWTMYFQGPYALHAAYWHNDFGYQKSRGCVNLTPRDARWLFQWSTPSPPRGERIVRSTQDHPGTWVYVYSEQAESVLTSRSRRDNGDDRPSRHYSATSVRAHACGWDIYGPHICGWKSAAKGFTIGINQNGGHGDSNAPHIGLHVSKSARRGRGLERSVSR